MTYARVIPRDLFNEAKLLTCLARLYIAAEITRGVEIEFTHDGGSFAIFQDANDGSIYCANVDVFVNGVSLHLYTPLNSREKWPLIATSLDEDDPVTVFDDEGNLTKEFVDTYSAVGAK